MYNGGARTNLFAPSIRLMILTFQFRSLPFDEIDAANEVAKWLRQGFAELDVIQDCGSLTRDDEALVQVVKASGDGHQILIQIASDSCNLATSSLAEESDASGNDLTQLQVTWLTWTDQVVLLITKASEQNQIAWHVSHQMEPELGIVLPGQPANDLVDNMMMSLQVAQSLAEIDIEEECLDDESLEEFDERDEIDDDINLLSQQADDEQNWFNPLESEPKFIRFEEWD